MPVAGPLVISLTILLDPVPCVVYHIICLLLRLCAELCLSYLHSTLNHTLVVAIYHTTLSHTPVVAIYYSTLSYTLVVAIY